MAILMPEKKPSMFGKVVGPAATLAGAAIGTAIAPGAGTALGASLGGAAGGIAGGIANKDVGQAAGSVAEGVTGGAGAMDRRLAASQATPSAPASTMMSEQTRALGEGAQAMSDLPTPQQEVYGPRIMDAYKQSLRRDFSRQA